MRSLRGSENPSACRYARNSKNQTSHRCLTCWPARLDLVECGHWGGCWFSHREKGTCSSCPELDPPFDRAGSRSYRWGAAYPEPGAPGSQNRGGARTGAGTKQGSFHPGPPAYFKLQGRRQAPTSPKRTIVEGQRGNLANPKHQHNYFCHLLLRHTSSTATRADTIIAHQETTSAHPGARLVARLLRSKIGRAVPFPE